MNRFIQMVEQIELIRDLIDRDNSNSYRLALILIDNAFEVLMFRQLKHEYQYSDLYYRLLENAKQCKMPDKEIAKLEEKVICDKRKKEIDRIFDEKLNYLCEVKRLISEDVKAAISYLHHYRNLTYHKEVIKHDTIKPAVYIYYKLLCDFFGGFQPNCYSSDSMALYKSFFDKYGLSSPYVFNEENLNEIKNKLKSEYALDGECLYENIKSHINNRIDEIKDAMQFIKDNSYDSKDRAKPLDSVLKDIYLWSHEKTKKRLNYRSMQDRPLMGIKELDDLLSKYQETKSSDEIKIFNMFSLIEPKIECVENVVFRFASELDAAIQLEIDIRRGK